MWVDGGPGIVGGRATDGGRVEAPTSVLLLNICNTGGGRERGGEREEVS